MTKVFLLIFESFLKDLREESNYKAHIAISIFSLTFLLAVIFLFSSQFASNQLVENRVSMFVFLLSGITLMELSFNAASCMPSNVRKLQIYGILEELMQSNWPLWFLILSASTYQIFKSTFRFFIYYLVAFLFFSFELYSYKHAFIFILLVIATIFSTLGIGVIGCAITLLIRKPNVFNSGFTYISIIFGGVFFSSSILPFKLEIISYLVPLFYGLEILRSIINFEQILLGELTLNFSVFFLMGFLYWIIGIKLLNSAVKKIKTDGSFYEY